MWSKNPRCLKFTWKFSRRSHKAFGLHNGWRWKKAATLNMNHPLEEICVSLLHLFHGASNFVLMLFKWGSCQDRTYWLWQCPASSEGISPWCLSQTFWHYHRVDLRHWEVFGGAGCCWCKWHMLWRLVGFVTLQGTSISHLWKRNIIFPTTLGAHRLALRRVVVPISLWENFFLMLLSSFENV